MGEILSVGSEAPRSAQTLDGFLAGVERRAFRMARIATGSRDEALDIVQDAMLALAKRYGDREPAEWGPLFHRILQSRIRDWYRRQQVRRRVFGWLGGSDDEQGDPLDAVADERTAGPAGEHAQTRFSEALERALRALPMRQQQAFLLRAWEGLDVAETARAMGITEGSVKTHYSRAVHALRDKLEGHAP
ncbi:MAG TPA: RNA polymerase sigma factor [Gammaproteobacteria bacterium]|nr:RNA polymerase sigma factor [Gammaproteobacteria bacterium]